MDDVIQILPGDFRELSQDLADDSVDLVLTDPPYPKEFLPLWDDLGRVAARVLKPSGFLVSYSGAMFLPEVMGMLGAHLDYWWLAGLHHLGPKARIWSHNILQAMKPVLIYQKPPFTKPTRRFINLLDSPAQSKAYHKWGQSVLPFRRLLETFSNRGDLVLDPFLGGGTSAEAAMQTGRRFIGYEIDPNEADIARRRVARERLFVAQPQPVQFDFDSAHLPRCNFCGATLETNGGPGRKREYCDGNCRLRAFRFRQREMETKLAVA